MSEAIIPRNEARRRAGLDGLDFTDCDDVGLSRTFIQDVSEAPAIATLGIINGLVLVTPFWAMVAYLLLG